MITSSEARRHGVHHDGSDLTPDEVELGRAVADFKRANNCLYLRNSELLAVMTSLGYRKVASPTELPKRVYLGS